MKTASGNSKTVAIIQDRIPQYRVPFFTRLSLVGSEDNVDYKVYTSDLDPFEQKNVFLQASLKNMRLRFPRNLYFHYQLDEIAKSDIVIIEQALHNPILLARLILDSKFKRKTLFWGHGGYWTKKNSALQNKILWFFVRRVSHFLVYTYGGAIRLIENGLPLDRITVLQNSIDSAAILGQIEVTGASDHSEWMKSNGLGSSNLGCFIGEFKKEKKLQFLFDAVRAIKLEVPDFQFVYFGYGDGLDSFKDLCKEHGWMIFGGVANELEKAQLSLAGAIILNPGRVGLIAVESIAMSCPMVTCRLNDQHAPEIEYLSEPSTIMMTEYDVTAYANAVVQLLNNPESKKAMSQSLKELQPLYTVDVMANNFHSAVMGRV